MKKCLDQLRQRTDEIDACRPARRASRMKRFYYLLRTQHPDDSSAPARNCPLRRSGLNTSPLPPRDERDNLLAQSNLLPASVDWSLDRPRSRALYPDKIGIENKRMKIFQFFGKWIQSFPLNIKPLILVSFS